MLTDNRPCDKTITECAKCALAWGDEVTILQNRLSDIISLCWGYDGFDTVEGLKSLIDDVVRMAKGETTYLVIGKDGVIGLEDENFDPIKP